MTSPLPLNPAARQAFDLAHLWHPFTQMKEAAQDPPVEVIGGEGSELLLADGRRIFDGISSWWTCLHGHSHPRLVGALERQAAKLDHVMFAGFTHAPAMELVQRLLPRMPKGLTRCFFSDDGSTAVEVALKMSFQAQLQKGETQRTRFGALRDGYHGDTLGAVGVGELDNYFSGLFRPLLLACDRVAVPEDPRRELNPDLTHWPAQLEEAREGLRTYFREHGERLAAFIAEPLIQCAGGMRMWPPELFQDLRSLCTEYGVYLIADEVATGFGRTGTFLACNQAGVAPDLLTLSKGLTGGTLPLALTWATEELYSRFWGEWAEGKAFLHGHSFTGNPIACAVAAASVALFDEAPVLEGASELSHVLTEIFHSLSEHPAVRQARVLGAIGACRMVDPKNGQPVPSAERRGWRLHRRALEVGLLVRPLGDCLYLLPPLGAPPEKLRSATEVLPSLLNELYLG